MELVETLNTLINASDATLSQHNFLTQRETEKQWRRQDIEHRQVELDFMSKEHAFMTSQQKWREEDINQRIVDNARVLWERYREKNRREIEERSEQLKSMENLTALIAGFAIIAFYEFQIDSQKADAVLQIMFGLSSALTVGLMFNSLMTFTFMHSGILKSGKIYVSETEEAEFMSRAVQYAKSRSGAQDIAMAQPPAPSRSFDRYWKARCERNWRQGFIMFIIGLCVFMVNLAVASFIKFQEQKLAAIMISIVMAFSVAYLGWTNRRWGIYLLGHEESNTAATGTFGTMVRGLPFDWHLTPDPRAYTSIPEVHIPDDDADTSTDVTIRTPETNVGAENGGVQAQAQAPFDEFQDIVME